MKNETVLGPDKEAAGRHSVPSGAPDMCVSCGNGMINIRVGAIILKGDRFLMVRNDLMDYYYSVGGRIKFGETSEEAVVREVQEETGVRLKVDHLGFIEENYFIADVPSKLGKEIYEIGYYYYMEVPDDFEPLCRSVTEDGQTEYLEWVSPDEKRTVFPEFFRTDLDIHDKTIRHTVKDDRFLKQSDDGLLSHEEKKHRLFLKQKALLEQFLKKGAISQAQHDKSLHDLTEKMGETF